MISLVEESVKKPNEEIKKDIIDELSKDPFRGLGSFSLVVDELWRLERLGVICHHLNA